MAESIGSNVAQDTPSTSAVLPVASQSPALPPISPADPGMAEGTLLAVSAMPTTDAITASDEAAMIAANDPFSGIPTLLAQAYAAILGRTVGVHTPGSHVSTIPADTLPLFSPLSMPTRERLAAVFVAPPTYANQYSADLDQAPLWIVHGPAQSGTSAAAIHLALQMQPDSACPILIGWRPAFDTQILIDQLADTVGVAPTVCIIEQAFTTPDDLHTLLPVLQRLTAIQPLRLILTTHLPEESLRLGNVSLISTACPLGQEREAWMQHIWHQHEQFYLQRQLITAAQSDLLRQEQKRLLRDYLHSPAQINYFCACLHTLPSTASVDDLYALAEQISPTDAHSTRHWFASLPHHGRLYALLIGLFPHLRAHDLHDIYIRMAQALRRDGWHDLCDPRTTGMFDLLALVHAAADECQVRFYAPALAWEVQHQITNHQHLLWSGLSAISIDLVRVYQEAQNELLWRALGYAWGQVGGNRLPRLAVLLTTLAQQPGMSGVTVAGYALAAACQCDPLAYPTLAALLRGWLEADDPDLPRAALHASWPLYQVLCASNAHAPRNLLWDGLASLADRLPWQSGDVASTTLDHACALLHTLRVLALHDPSDATHQLRAWMAAQSGRCVCAQAAGRLLYAELADAQQQPLNPRYMPLLDLCGCLLAADAATRHTVLAALLVWIEQADWTAPIHAALLRALNRMGATERCQLRDWLVTYGVGHHVDKVQQVIHTLIVRSYALDGLPLDVPGQRYGILVLDGSDAASRCQISIRAGKQLYARLGATYDLYVGMLGNNDWLTQPRRSIFTAPETHPRPRLLYPLLERMNLATCAFVLVLTWGPLPDLADVWHSPWRERLIIIPVAHETDYVPALPVSTVDPLLPIADLQAIETMARTRYTRQLAILSARQWWAELQKSIKVSAHNGKALGTKLSTWLKQLDDLRSVQPSGDQARLIIGVILGLAVRELPRAVKLVRAWLQSNDAHTRRMGLAAGRALFLLYAERPLLTTTTDALVEPDTLLLELALPLANADSSGAAAILYAIRCRADDPAWAAALGLRVDGATPATFSLATLVDSLLPAQRSWLLGTLATWHQLSEDASAPDVPAVVSRLATRLEFQIRVRTQHKIPDPPSDIRYGIIIVDSQTRDTSGYNRLVAIATRLVQQVYDTSNERIWLLVYQMGQSDPVALPGITIQPEMLFAPGGVRRPRLIGPILERHTLQQVSFWLVLTNDCWLDAQDWLASAWYERARVYRDQPWRPWQLPVPVMARQETVAEAVAYIADQLALLIQQR